MYSNAGYVYSQLSGPKGLINLGSTCYVNGILQCLMGIKDLISLLAKQKENGPLSSALSDVLLSLDSVGEAEDISEFMCIIAEHWENYRPNTQMDSEEFLTFLLLAIHEEMKSKSGNLEVVIGSDMIQNCINAWTCHNTSSISSLFCVQIVTLTFCPNCKYSHGQYSDINSHLSVELPLVEHKTKQEMKKAIRLEECLLSFTKEEEQTDAICSTCKSVGLKHRLIIGRLPPVLVIHLKRFKLHYNGSLKKIVKEVSIPEHLDLAPYTVELLQSNTSYTLIGMTDHHGTSVHNGHYTAVSLRDERWYRFDDTKVSSTTSRKLGSTSNTAYLVWYRLKKDVEGDLPLDKIPMTLTDKAASIANTPEVQSNTSCSNNDIDRNFINSDGESEVDMFAITDESDTDSDDRIFQIKMPKSNTSTAREWHPDKAARALNNLTVSDPSQQEANHVPPLQLCDHPLYDLDIMDPQLTEDDVPGAKLNIDDIDMCDVGTLKRWLQCRRITTTGVKADLKSRVIFHVLNGKENKIYQGFEEGKWYEEKRKRLMAEAHASNQKSFPMMPFGPKIFQPFPSVHIPNNYSSEKARDYLDLIPDIRFSYKGGVESRNGHEAEEEVEVDFSQPTQEDRKNIFVDGTLKRANNFIDSGRVLGITDCIRNLHYFVKADVKASYTNTIYKVSVMIAKLSGHVCFAECTCKARSLGRCCHIMAVLLLIGRHVASKGHEAVTCTGRLCYWLAPSSATHRRPGVVHEKNEYYKTSSNFKRRADFDPRPTNQQLLCDPDRVNLLRAKLNGMTNKLLWYYQLLESPITADSYPDVVATYQIAEMCSHLIWNLNSIRNCSTSRPIHLLKTAGQSGNEFWHSERSVRITASVAKVVLGLSMDSSRMSFMRKHVWGLDPFSNAGMQRGNEMEGPARNAYRHHLKQADADIDILESGSWVNPAFPSLSCSPDGLIVNTNGIIRLLEIKCPAVLTEMDPNHFEKLPKRQLSSFCIKRDERTGQLELKPTHKWYYQVQMSLSIMQLEWCDFVVYSTVQNIPKFMIVKVQYNEEFWREKRERLISIHRQWFVPEHFLGNTIFNRPPVRLIYAPFHEEHDDEFFLFGSHLTDEDQSHLHETEDGFLIDLI